MLIAMEANTSSNQRPVIQAREILDKIERGEDVEYDGVIIEGDLDISGLELRTEHVKRTDEEKEGGLLEDLGVFSSQINITNSEIRGTVNFSDAHFEELINFGGSEFCGDAYFWYAIFGGRANFRGAEFGGDAYFGGCKFIGEEANFSEAEFSGYAIFSDAEFRRKADFQRAGFDGDADFQRGEFDGYAGFRGAEFGGNVTFFDAKFSAIIAEFRGAMFDGDADFRRGEFGGYADFDHDQFNSDVSFDDTKFSRPASQEVACRIAKRKMEEQGDKKASDDYFYREMEAIRLGNGIKGTKKLLWPWKVQFSEMVSPEKIQVFEWLKLAASKVWRLIRYDLLEYIFIQGIFGYGVHPIRLFGFWILMVFLFASYYWYYDAVEGASAWFDYIWFSIATPGYALYSPVGHYKIVTGVQAIFGTFMWAAFIAYLREKVAAVMRPAGRSRPRGRRRRGGRREMAPPGERIGMV